MKEFGFFLSLGLLMIVLLHDLNVPHPSEALSDDAILIVVLFVIVGMLGTSIWKKKERN